MPASQNRVPSQTDGRVVDIFLAPLPIDHDETPRARPDEHDKRLAEAGRDERRFVGRVFGRPYRKGEAVLEIRPAKAVEDRVRILDFFRVCSKVSAVHEA
jgi:hypothetical protein